MGFAIYSVDQRTSVGQGVRQRVEGLGRYLDIVAGEIREFHARHRRVAQLSQL